MQHRRRPGNAAAPRDIAAELPGDESERGKPNEEESPDPKAGSVARAERFHELIEELKSSEQPASEQARGHSLSPREFIHQRMREIAEDEKD